jgi:murein DD-endopeptidase MepM/ murein hydrolase activator NlpD
MKAIFNKTGNTIKKLINGRAFYAVLAGCIALVGIGGYVATRVALNRMGEVIHLNSNSLWDPFESQIFGGGSDNSQEGNPANANPSQNTSDHFAGSDFFDGFDPNRPYDWDAEAASAVPANDSNGGTNASNSPVFSGSDKGDGVPAMATQIYVQPLHGEIIKPFAVDTLVFSRTMRDWRTHSGIGIAAEPGTRVVAITDGIVEDIYQDELYGWSVAIRHPDGLISIYRCLTEAITVSVGDLVQRGQVIGGISGEGYLMAAGDVPHLHFELIRNGRHIDPAEIFTW